MKVLGARAIFAASAAIVAAALVDPLVEALSNAGAFGSGKLTDGSNADVLPSLLVGLLLCAIFVALNVRRKLRGTVAARRMGWSKPGLDPLSAIALVPVIYPLQLALLYAIETLEQRVVVGHLYGGTIWLGGPVLASLLLHLVGAIVVTAVLAWALDGAATRVAEIVYIAAEELARADFGYSLSRYQPVPVGWPLVPSRSRLKGRAPPHPLQ